jgi:serine phosphatase RsbU (regulator of sigma subunit)
MPLLVVLSGPKQGQRFSIDHSTVIGRGELAEVVLPDNLISRRHAQISLGDGRCFLADLQSGNGTFLNGLRVTTPVALTAGDQIAVGNTKLEFRLEPGKGGRDSSFISRLAFDEHRQDISRSIVLPMASVSGASSASLPRGSKREEEMLRQRLQFFADVAEMMSETPDEGVLLSLILKRVMAAMPQADRSFIVLYDEETKEFLPRVARTRSGEAEEIPASRTLLRDAVDNRRAILSVDVAGDARLHESGTVRRIGLRSFVCVPLIANERVCGVFQVDNADERHPFTEADLAALAGIAAPIALSIANARLHRQLLARSIEEHDMALARRIQKLFLPVAFPELAAYRFAAEYSPAMAVGGDLYDVMELPDGRVGMMVGDVSGKGVAAALVMARLTSDLRFLAGSRWRPDALLRRLNEILSLASAEGMFVTALYLVLDPASGQIELANAGHLRPLVRRGNGVVEELKLASGMPLGIDPGTRYAIEAAHLGVGDVLVLYSDGVTEATSPDGAAFGVERLLAAMAQAGPEPESVLETSLRSLRNFLRGKGLDDDVTLLCLGRGFSGLPRSLSSRVTLA